LRPIPQKALENPTPEVKQEVLRLLVESIVVEDNAITIKHIIPTDDNSRLLPRGNVRKSPSLKIRAPRVHDKVPDQHFTSAILPPYLRRAPQLESALPVYIYVACPPTTFARRWPPCSVKKR
jgi:hypothetical protein